MYPNLVKMAGAKNGLYGWDRFSKKSDINSKTIMPSSRLYSRSQRVTTDNDIQDWIKTVEDASHNAAVETFGSGVVGKKKPSKTVSATIQDVHLHDAAYSEAQDLLQQWVEEKVVLKGENDDGIDIEDDDGVDARWERRTQSAICREWDNLLHSCDDENPELEEWMDAKKRAMKPDPYSILDQDEDQLVENVLQNMLEKEVIHDSVTKDLGLQEKNPVDPRTKMQLRHQQVKDNRDKRLIEKERRLRELKSLKDSRHQARQIVQKEEKSKVTQARKEELQIQQEMAKIRREMAEERKAKEDKKIAEMKREEQYSEEIRELDEKKQSQWNQRLDKQNKEDERKAKIMALILKADSHKAADRIKVLHKYFTTWYEVVMERRLQMGKAKAMSDWKLLVQTWHSWKSLVRRKKLKQEARRHEVEVKETYRKDLMAKQHYEHKILRKYFASWQVFIAQQQYQMIYAQGESTTKSKMSTFLETIEAAQQINSDRSVLSCGVPKNSISTDRKVDAIFDHEKKEAKNSCRSGSSARQKRNQNKLPSEAWQVTKKHVNLSPNEIDSLGKPHGDQLPVDEESSEAGVKTYSSRSESEKNVKAGARPWEKSPYRVNNMENRHMAQQKILETQQNQIKEQQRLIEDLQYLQRQQLLQQKLTQQQLMSQKTKIEPRPAWQDNKPEHVNSTRSASDTPHIIEHIGTLQKHLTKHENVEQNTSPLVSERSDLKTDRSLISSTTGTDISTTTKMSANAKHAKFTKAMEERATERARMKKERDDAKKRVEEEKLVRLEAEAQERLIQEETEKKQRIEAYKIKKRLEKEKEEEKNRQAVRLQHMIKSADKHNHVRLMRIGCLAFIKLMEIGRTNWEKAQAYHKQTLLRNCFKSWVHVVEEQVKEKKSLADEMSRYILIRRCFDNWKKVRQYSDIQEEKAKRFHKRRLLSRIVNAWANFAEEEKISMWRKERKATEHNTWRLQVTVLRTWRRFPQMLRNEEEKEKRRVQMRRKVAGLLSDYEPSTSHFTTDSWEDL